ncbi:MAG: O-antigen ligase family protein [Thermoleophilia bacterium]|nr:O-antigen ligase family protein [Thermoleophilia bacterium]
MPEAVKKASLYMLLAALLLGTLWRGGYFPEQKWPFALALLAAGAVEIAVTTAVGSARALRSPAFWSLAAFTLYAVITRAWSVAPADTDRESMLMGGYLATFFVVRSQIVRYGGLALGAVASWFVYAATFTAAWGLATFLWRWGPYAAMLDDVFRAGSTFEYSNALSCFSLMALPVTVALQRRAASPDRSLLAVAVTLQAVAVLVSYARFGIVMLAALSLYLSFSGWRGGFALSTAFSLAMALPIGVVATMASESGDPFTGLLIIFVIMVVVWLVESYLDAPKFRSALRAVAALSAAGGLAAAVLLANRSERMQVILSIRFREGFSLSRLLPHRLDTWQGAVDAYRVRPLTGSGLGSFAQVFAQYTIAVYTKYAHNLIIQTAVDTGIIGVVWLALFLGYVIVLSVWRLVVASHPLARAFAVSSLTFIVYNMFDWEWYVPALTAWFMVGVACLEAMPGEGLEEGEPETGKSYLTTISVVKKAI